jgi:TRAP-type C4-dicarboxylate transport system permease small subunit
VYRFRQWLEGLCRAGAFLSALFMGIIVALIMVEIILRSIFNVSTLVASEFSGYMLVAVVALGLGYTMQHRSHIRITIFWDRFSDTWKRRADIILASLSAAICLFFLYYSVLMVYETYSLGMEADTISETPLWIPQTSIPIGLFLLFLQLVALIIRSARS